MIQAIEWIEPIVHFYFCYEIGNCQYQSLSIRVISAKLINSIHESSCGDGKFMRSLTEFAIVYVRFLIPNGSNQFVCQ